MTNNNDNLNHIEILPEQPQRDGSKRRKSVIFVVALLLTITLAIVTAVLIKSLVITTYVTNGISMYPTLDGGSGENSDSISQNGEILILNKTAKIKHGDIVVFKPEWEMGLGSNGLVKRVIALPGDHLQITDNKVFLNGELLVEDYIFETMNTFDIDVTIPAGHFFAMGDNRNNSSDCRIYGTAELDWIVGKCFLIKGLDGKYRSIN